MHLPLRWERAAGRDFDVHLGDAIPHRGADCFQAAALCRLRSFGSDADVGLAAHVGSVPCEDDEPDGELHGYLDHEYLRICNAFGATLGVEPSPTSPERVAYADGQAGTTDVLRVGGGRNYSQTPAHSQESPH